MAYSPLIEPIGKQLIRLTVTDSTNNYAMELIRQGRAAHGLLIMAEQQTAGKGQRGRQWKSQTGESMLLSLVLNPLGVSLHRQFLLSAAIALGCYDFLKIYCTDDGVKIKWPNDLYWQDRKTGGILIENSIAAVHDEAQQNSCGGSWKWAVAGIGININQAKFPEDLPNPVSLRQITGKTYDITALTVELTTNLKKYLSWITEEKQDDILNAYQDALYRKGERVRLKKGNVVFDTMVQGVNVNGQLITTDTLERKFDFGEVEWLR